MEILDRLEVDDGQQIRFIELVRGDLTDIPSDHAIDILVVSALPNDYSPTSSSLIGGLHSRGLSVAALAQDKDVDLRATSSSWMSRALDPRPGLPFRRVLCFEPRDPLEGPGRVGDLFRALLPFLPPGAVDATIAMPLVTAGDARREPEAVIEAILEAATQWLTFGVPIARLQVFVRSNDSVRAATEAFRRWRTSTSDASGESGAGRVPELLAPRYRRRRLHTRRARGAWPERFR